MMTDLPNVEGVPDRPEGQDDSFGKGHEPEKARVIEVARDRGPEPGARRETRGIAESGVRRHSSDITADLEREGANMLALQMRQARCVTPLSVSSKATQAMLRQF